LQAEKKLKQVKPANALNVRENVCVTRLFLPKMCGGKKLPYIIIKLKVGFKVKAELN
jgi:hypothetical protein